MIGRLNNFTWQSVKLIHTLFYKQYTTTVETGSAGNGEYEKLDPKSEDEVVNVIYTDRDGKQHNVRGKIGDNVMFLAQRHGLPIEGACGGTLACSTCHLYVNDNYLDNLEEPPEGEEDLLGMAAYPRENSRLGCQITLTKELEGVELTLPAATRNFYVDGHVPKAH